MVKISQAVKKIEASLGSLEGSELTLKDDLTAGEFEKVMQDTKDMQMLFTALSLLIVDWNLEDDDGKKMPINKESLKMLSMFDLKDLLSKTGFGKKLDEMQKKARLLQRRDSTRADKY